MGRPTLLWSFRRVMVVAGVTVFCALIIAASIQTMQAAAQTTFAVTNLNDSGSGSLRQAILDANATPGADVIHITANGQLNLLSPLPIINEAVTIFVPDANTFRVFKIDGQNLHRGLVITAVPVTITGLTIQNSVATGDLRGGGIKSDGPLTLNNVTLLNNSAQGVGGGVFSTGAVTVNNGRFEGNQAWGNGGGLFTSGPLIINGGVIYNNHCVTQFCKGGGLYATQALTLTNTQILSNTAMQYGGGVYVQGSRLAATGSVVQGNRCIDSFCEGGGLYAQNQLRLVETVIQDNHALGRGGGAVALGAAEISGGRFEANGSERDGGGLLAAGPLTASNALWLDNSAQTNGGGTAVQGNGPVQLTNSHFENNSGGDGGGMSVSLADTILTGVTFAGNHSVGGGAGLKARNVTLIGGRFAENSATLGVGGLHADSVVLTGTHFINNSPGGASVLHITATNFLFESNSQGAAISAVHTVTLHDGQIVNNSGGLMGAPAVYGAIVEVTNVLFADNTGAFAGGSALTASQHATITNSRFVNNSSETASGGIGATGDLTIKDSFFIFNSGDVGGGVQASGSLTITGTIFRENQARLGGGVAHDAGDGLIVNTLFDNNSASEGGTAVSLQGSGTDQLTHVTIASAGVVTSTAVATTKEILLIRNTIVVNHAVGLHVTSGLAVLNSTLFHGNGTDIQGTVSFDQNRIAANPLFANPGAGNYRLQSGSPAIDAGLDVGILVDFEGDERPFGNGFDIGCDEFVLIRVMLPIIMR